MQTAAVPGMQEPQRVVVSQSPVIDSRWNPACTARGRNVTVVICIQIYFMQQKTLKSEHPPSSDRAQQPAVIKAIKGDPLAKAGRQGGCILLKTNNTHSWTLTGSAGELLFQNTCVLSPAGCLNYLNLKPASFKRLQAGFCR